MTKNVTEEEFNTNKDVKGYVFVSNVEKPTKNVDTKDKDKSADPKENKENENKTSEKDDKPANDKPSAEPKMVKVKFTESENKKVATPVEIEVTLSNPPLNADLMNK